MVMTCDTGVGHLVVAHVLHSSDERAPLARTLLTSAPHSSTMSQPSANSCGAGALGALRTLARRPLVVVLEDLEVEQELGLNDARDGADMVHEHVHELFTIVGDDAHDDVEVPGADAHVVHLRQLGDLFGDRLQALALDTRVHRRVQSERLEAVAEEVAELPQVDYVSICAGNFDIIVGIVAHDREELMNVLVNHIRTIPGIVQAEFLLNLKILKDNYEWSPDEGTERAPK